MSYEAVATREGGVDLSIHPPLLQDSTMAFRSLLNFGVMSVLFSANHGCVVACLALATAQLGAIGAWQSGILYLTYTGSAFFGATYVVKSLGARNAMMVGMSAYVVYVGCFWLATVWTEYERVAAYVGATIGGSGAGCLWTAQGTYFTQAAEEYATQSGQPTTLCTSKLAGIFAFVYLGEEVLLRALSTLLIELQLPWSMVFETYLMVSVVATIGMVQVRNFADSSSSQPTATMAFEKATSATRLLYTDSKMKYMVGLNAAFGFSAAFMNSYVNGEVVRVVMGDTALLGILTAFLSVVAATMSLLLGKITEKIDKVYFLMLGSVCFALVALPFVVLPDTAHWSGWMLWLIYCFHGMGRATFESTLKATFADYFASEKEGAFANIVLQSGLASAIGYVLSFALKCYHESAYCIKYDDGSLHDVLSFELLIVVTAVAATLGLWRASMLRRFEVAGNEPMTDESGAGLLDVSGEDQVE